MTLIFLLQIGIIKQLYIKFSTVLEEVILEASQTVHLKRLVTVDILVALLMHQVKALALAMATTVTCLAVPHKHLVKASGK